MEPMKTMIHDQDLPMHLWVEATRTTIYVQKRISHSSLGFKNPKEMFTGKKPEVSHLNIFGCPIRVHIPEEIFMGKKPEVSHLNIFGCPIYVHIPKEKRTKLDPSRKRGYLLVTVKYPMHSKFTFLDSITWKSVEM